MGQTTIETLELVEQVVEHDVSYCDECGKTDVELFPVAVNPSAGRYGQIRADHTAEHCRGCAELLVGESLGPPSETTIELNRSDTIEIEWTHGSIYALDRLDLGTLIVGLGFLLLGGIFAGASLAPWDIAGLVIALAPIGVAIACFWSVWNDAIWQSRGIRSVQKKHRGGR